MRAHGHLHSTCMDRQVDQSWLIAVVLRLFIAVPAVCGAAHAEPVDTMRHERWSVATAHLGVRDVRACLQSTLDFFTAPERAQAGQWAAFLGVAVVDLAVMMSADREIQARVSRNRTPALTDFVEPLQYYGDGTVDASLSASLYLLGLLTRSERLREAGRDALLSLALSAMVSWGLKIAVGRSRPYTGDGSLEFSPYATQTAHQSFPSGHSTAAFALSTSLACTIHRPWAGVLLYAAATMVAVQRVYGDKHWASDVIAGAALGIASGVSVYRSGRRADEQTAFRPRIEPRLVRGAVGCVVECDF